MGYVGTCTISLVYLPVPFLFKWNQPLFGVLYFQTLSCSVLNCAHRVHENFDSSESNLATNMDMTAHMPSPSVAMSMSMATSASAMAATAAAAMPMSMEDSGGCKISVSSLCFQLWSPSRGRTVNLVDHTALGKFPLRVTRASPQGEQIVPWNLLKHSDHISIECRANCIRCCWTGIQ